MRVFTYKVHVLKHTDFHTYVHKETYKLAQAHGRPIRRAGQVACPPVITMSTINLRSSSTPGTRPRATRLSGWPETKRRCIYTNRKGNDKSVNNINASDIRPSRSVCSSAEHLKGVRETESPVRNKRSRRILKKDQT